MKSKFFTPIDLLISLINFVVMTCLEVNPIAAIVVSVIVTLWVKGSPSTNYSIEPSVIELLFDKRYVKTHQDKY